jgi:hypothetical protein
MKLFKIHCMYTVFRIYNVKCLIIPFNSLLLSLTDETSISVLRIENYPTDTIKATETRLELDLQPIYIKLKIIMPKR